MDFRHQITTVGALAGVSVDALALVLIGESVDPALDPALATLLADAVEHGDLKLKKGKSLYVHRPAGVRAARVALAVAEDSSPKAIKAAAAHAIAVIKNGGTRHLGVAVIGAPDENWGEAVTAVVVARPGTQPSAEALIDLVKKHKGSTHAPKHVKFVTELPMTGVGKVDKKVLKAGFWTGRDRMVG